MFKKTVFILFLSIIYFLNSFAITLVKDDKPLYKILFLGDKKDCIKPASILDNYLDIYYLENFKITKKVKNNQKYIVVGKCSKIAEVFPIKCANVPQGFYIKKYKDNIIIAGFDKAGLENGIYYFLEKYLGIKWFSKDFIYYPESPIKNISVISKEIKPDFKFREVFVKESDDFQFSEANHLNGRTGHRANKNLSSYYIPVYLLKPDRLLSRKLFSKYSCNGQLNYTNPKLFKIYIKKLEKFLSKIDTSKKTIVVLQNKDTSSYCKSFKSRQLIKMYKSKGAPYFLFVKKIAQKLKNKYPNVEFFISAYKSGFKAPVGIEFPENVGIFISDIDNDLSKPINHRYNKSFWKNFKKWIKLSDNIYIWHYITNFSDYTMPFPVLSPTVETIKILKEYPQVKGIFLQGAYDTYGSYMVDMNTWIYSKYLFGTNKTLDELRGEFINKFYGEAAPYIKEYLSLLNKSFKNNPIPLYVKTPPNAKFLNLEFLMKAEQIFNYALEETNDDLYKDNIKKLKLSIDTTILLNLPYLKKEAIEKNIVEFDKHYIKSIKKDWKREVKRFKLSKFSESISIREIKPILFMDRPIPKAPKIVKQKNLVEGKDWFDFQEYTLKLCCVKFVKDPNASDSVAVYMKGKQTDWGVQFNLSYLPKKGKWDVYMSVRVVPYKNSLSLTDKYKFAFFYGNGKVKKNFSFVKSVAKEKYIDIKVGTFEQKRGEVIWIRPPGSKAIKYLYVDRVFIVRADDDNDNDNDDDDD